MILDLIQKKNAVRSEIKKPKEKGWTNEPRGLKIIV